MALKAIDIKVSFDSDSTVYCVCCKYVEDCEIQERLRKCLKRSKIITRIAKENGKCVGLHRKILEFQEGINCGCCFVIAFLMLVLHAYNVHRPATATVIIIIIAIQ